MDRLRVVIDWCSLVTTGGGGGGGAHARDVRNEGAMKRAELTAFLCLLRKAFGPAVVHIDDKGTTDGLLREDADEVH